MTNYNLRGNFTIISNDYETDRGDENLPEWLSTFAKELVAKTAVETARERDEAASIADQINSIMGSKNKYSTVEEAVASYTKLTGLSEYLNKVQAGNAGSVSKKAQQIISMPKLFEAHPEIKFFIDNLVKTRHGKIHVPAVSLDIMDVYKNQGVTQGDVDDPEVMKYINEIIAQEESQHFEPEQSNIGKGVGIEKEDDNSNTDDAFSFA